MTKEGEGKNALITGASAGIGAALAEEFARHGFDVVLVSRRAEKLHRVAQQIHDKYRVETHVITSDLSQPEAPTLLFDELGNRELTVHALVNNAGLGLAGSFSEISWSVHNEFIQLMGTNVAHLCHLAIPQMRKAGYGRILNVASVAAFAPGTAGSLYRAIKSFVVHLSTSLNAENKGQNIYCTALCPGLTHTEFHQVMGAEEEFRKKFPKFVWMDAETVAKQGYTALMKGESIFINGWIYKIASRLSKSLFY